MGTVLDMLNKFKPIKQLLEFLDIKSDTVQWKKQGRSAVKLIYYSCFAEIYPGIVE